MRQRPRFPVEDLGPVPGIPNPPLTSDQIRSSGTVYTVQPGTLSVSTNRSPYASAAANAWCGASVYYTASIAPVTVGLGGVTAKAEDHSLNILIGQGCTASLNAAPFSLNNYVWIIGGDTFKSYEAHGVGSGGFAHTTFLDAADLQLASPHWYWRSEDGWGSEPEWVTGYADAYAGPQYVGRVTATRWVTVWAPYYFCGYNARDVTLDINATNDVFIGAGSWAQNGIDWTGRAIPPALFGTAGLGLWAFVQKMFSTRSYTDNGVRMCSANNGLPGLDTSFPYGPDGGILEADDPNAGWPDDDSERQDGDGPGLSNVPDTVSSVDLSDQFWTWMMYRPADIGQGHMWVPLHQIAWQWSANVNRPGNSWLNWAGPFPSILGPVTVTSIGRYTVHPEWNRVLLGTAPYAPCP